MKKIALFESTGRTEVVQWAKKVAALLKSYNVEVYAFPEFCRVLRSSNDQNYEYIKPVTFENIENTVDCLISFGGDGTMLSAARMLIQKNLPILGINVGKLGFLAEYPTSNLDSAIKNLVEGNFRIVERSVIETELNGEILYAINDFVVEKKDSSRMITVQAFSNANHIADYRADGLIINTPTGSTAYSLSCGGPIIAPLTQVICLTPISPHSLTLRPLVIPDNVKLRLSVHSHSGEANFVADGQIQRTLLSNENVVIRKSEHTIKFIKPIDKSYYDLLRAKLLWSINVIDSDIKN